MLYRLKRLQPSQVQYRFFKASDSKCNIRINDKRGIGFVMTQRKITIHAAAPAVDKNEIARILAYYITGGDAAGYLSKLAEKQRKEAENLKAI